VYLPKMMLFAWFVSWFLYECDGQLYRDWGLSWLEVIRRAY
jgi:hypothetical protein